MTKSLRNISPVWTAVLVLGSLMIAREAAAERQHIVSGGQSLELIARRYKLSAAELAAANGLGEHAALRGGQVLTVPPEGIVFVAAGQTLGGIALVHKCSVAELARANQIEVDATLQVGQRLVLPGYRVSKADVASEKRWGAPKQRGTVTLYRIWSGETEQMRLVDTRGRLRSVAQKQMREFLRPRDSKKRKAPNARLLSLLARVSDHYGGRPIHVVSGYRLAGGFTRKTSRHVAGEAIDFRIPGVSLTELRDYCQRFDNVGVGYYPRSQFVHLDVRKEPGRWTDWSLPGQAAILREPSDLLDPSTGGVASAVHKVEIEKADSTDDDQGAYDPKALPPAPGER